nr:M56 family metallopeptidase [uncultured Carboxylicivirga sp.]
MAYLIEWQVKAALIVALMVVVFVLFLSKDAMFTRNRIWLLSALIVPAVVPVLAMPNFVRSILFAEGTPVELLNLSIPLTNETVATAQSNSVWQWSHLFIAIYILVSLVLLIRLVWGYSYLQKLKNKSKKLKVKGLNLYLIEDKEINPFSFFQSVFVPQSVMEQEDKNLILNHEQTHCRQWHSIDITLAEWMLVIQWWNPFVWWLRKLIAQNHEFCVDKAMMQTSEEPRKYQYSLINYLPGSTQLRLVNNFSQSLIKKRIIMMNNTIQNKIKTQLKGVFITAFTAIALLACTDSDKTISDEETQTIEGARAVIDYEDGSTYSVVLTDKGLVEETENVKGVQFILNNELVDWSLVKGLKADQIKALGQVEVGRSFGDLLPADNNGAIFVMTKDYEIPKSEQSISDQIIYLNGEIYTEDINSISPDDIDAINVLKGEAAVEKYGEGYKAGVIEITTKKGGENTGDIETVIDKATKID